MSEQTLFNAIPTVFWYFWYTSGIIGSLLWMLVEEKKLKTLNTRADIILSVGFCFLIAIFGPFMFYGIISEVVKYTPIHRWLNEEL